jgi:hypothetical protein
MNTNITFANRVRNEDWQPLLEIAILEVFEIILGCKVRASVQSERSSGGGFTAVAGALCGVVTVCCSANTAGYLAQRNVGRRS